MCCAFSLETSAVVIVAPDNGSVVMGMDAPYGIGSAPRDRLGLRVDADGVSSA